MFVISMSAPLISRLEVDEGSITFLVQVFELTFEIHIKDWP